jgi:hypothetical protein
MAGAVSSSSLTVNSNNISAVNSLGFRNRIINGAMVIDQRNNGASVDTSNTIGTTYTIDRWAYRVLAASKFTIQQNAGSLSAANRPAGFTNYLGCTSSSAYSVGSGDVFNVWQSIEGFNTADLAFGTASAQAITLSFWVRSSLTGTFSGAFRNNDGSRSYVFTYTISAANTWEYKTIAIAGDQSGTWATGNTIGLHVQFSLGVGSTFSTTAGSWQTGNFFGLSTATNVVGTNGATFYITGVQLEAGSVATPFERRDYGRELIMCQRYYEKSYNFDVVAGAVSTLGAINNYVQLNGSYCTGGGLMGRFAVLKRATPTVTVYSTATGASGQIRDDNAGADRAATVDQVGQSGFRAYCSFTAQAAVNLNAQFVASIEL